MIQIEICLTETFAGVCSRPKKSEKEINTSLVVVPHTIFKQWSKTISEETTLKFLGVNTSKTLKTVEELKDSDPTNISDDDEPINFIKSGKEKVLKNMI